MAKKTALKKFTGVYFTESKIKKYRERPDRCYWVAFRESRNNKLRWERCGWLSEAWTPEAAQHRRRELLEEDRAGKYKPKRERKADLLTFGEFMEKHFLPWTEGENKHGHKDRARYELWLKPKLAAKPLKEIAPLDLERIKKDLRDKGRSEATVRHVLSIVRHAFKKAERFGLWYGESPLKPDMFPKLNNARQKFLSLEEATRLLETIRKRSIQVSQIAAMSLYGGMRLGEILGLTWSNVNGEIIYVQDTKNKQSRPIFITEPIAKILGELSRGNPDELLFQTKAGKPVKQLSKTFRLVVDDLKLNERIKDPRERVCFHTLRHTYASWAVMSEVPLYIVGRTLGHKSLVMTQRYAHLAPDSLRKAFEAVAKFASTNKDSLSESEGSI